MRTPDLCLSINRADPGVQSYRLDPVLAGCWGQRGGTTWDPHPRHIQAAGICPRFWQLQPRAAPAMGAGNRWVGSAECCLGSAPGEGEKQGERGGRGWRKGGHPARSHPMRPLALAIPDFLSQANSCPKPSSPPLLSPWFAATCSPKQGSDGLRELQQRGWQRAAVASPPLSTQGSSPRGFGGPGCARGGVLGQEQWC